MVASVDAFHDCFDQVDDPRVAGRCDHPLNSILFLIVSAVISGADGPADIEEFGHNREDWLATFVDFPAGIPSHDTIGRLLSIIKPDQLQVAMKQWLDALRAEHAASETAAGQEAGSNNPVHVAIDGKTAKGSYRATDKSDALHIVSAWASENGLTLGQVAVDSKSNEITAIPELLDTMDLRGTNITIDAMGCQKSIAAKIIDGGGDYTLAVKDNHSKLCEAIEQHFEYAHEQGLVESGMRTKQTTTKQAGRREVRTYAVGKIPASMQNLSDQWKGAKSIGQSITMTTVGEKETFEVRYYISSREAKVGEFAEAVRGHWSIESMHWILDVVFHEDASRIRTGNAIANMSFLRRFITTILKRDTTKMSLKQKRKAAGWNTDFLEKLLFPTQI